MRNMYTQVVVLTQWIERQQMVSGDKGIETRYMTKIFSYFWYLQLSSTDIQITPRYYLDIQILSRYYLGIIQIAKYYLDIIQTSRVYLEYIQILFRYYSRCTKQIARSPQRTASQCQLAVRCGLRAAGVELGSSKQKPIELTSTLKHPNRCQ